jgi:hypothetical protein
VKHHVDVVGIGIDCVPYQLGNGEDWLADLGNPLKVIVLDLNLEGLGRHGAGVRVRNSASLVHSTRWARF